MDRFKDNQYCSGGFCDRIRDARFIMWNDKMDKGGIIMNLDVAALNAENPCIREVTHKFGVPDTVNVEFYDYLDRDVMVDRVMCRLADLSLTHRIMFTEDNGNIYVTESKDHTTNIDTDVLEAIKKFSERRFP
jgi:hypothetical protein